MRFGCKGGKSGFWRDKEEDKGLLIYTDDGRSRRERREHGGEPSISLSEERLARSDSGWSASYRRHQRHGRQWQKSHMKGPASAPARTGPPRLSSLVRRRELTPLSTTITTTSASVSTTTTASTGYTHSLAACHIAAATTLLDCTLPSHHPPPFPQSVHSSLLSGFFRPHSSLSTPPRPRPRPP